MSHINYPRHRKNDTAIADTSGKSVWDISIVDTSSIEEEEVEIVDTSTNNTPLVDTPTGGVHTTPVSAQEGTDSVGEGSAPAHTETDTKSGTEMHTETDTKGGENTSSSVWDTPVSTQNGTDNTREKLPTISAQATLNLHADMLCDSRFMQPRSGIRKGRRPAGSKPWKPKFLRAIAEGYTVAHAAKIAGVHDRIPYHARKKDKKFREEWHKAAQIGTALLEYEAQRRAYHGVDKPVYYKGEVCGSVKEYSDSMLIFLLKARKPEVYRDSHENSGNVNVSVQANIAAVKLLNELDSNDTTNNERADTNLLTSSGITSAPGTGRHIRQVESGPSSTVDERNASKSMEDTE